MIKDETALNLSTIFSFLYKEDIKNNDDAWFIELIELKALIDEHEGRKVDLEEIIGKPNSKLTKKDTTDFDEGREFFDGDPQDYGDN